MRTCDYCELEIGRSYRLAGNSTAECCGIEIHNDGDLVLYYGYDEAFHYFRAHKSRRCPSCGGRLFNITMPCGYYRDGLFIREDTEVPVERETQ